MHKFQFTAFYLLGPGFAIASVMCYFEAMTTNVCRWVLGAKKFADCMKTRGELTPVTALMNVLRFRLFHKTSKKDKDC